MPAMATLPIFGPSASSTDQDYQTTMTQSFANSGSLAFRELELLKTSAESAKSALTELQSRTIQFRALRDHIRLAFKPFRDFLRELAVQHSTENADHRVIALLLCERTIQYGFWSIFTKHASAKSRPDGLTVSGMSNALLSNVIGPVISEAAFSAVRGSYAGSDVAELRKLTNEHIAKLRGSRPKYAERLQPVVQQMVAYLDENWEALYVVCRQFNSLSEIAGDLQQVVDTSRALGMSGKPGTGSS